LKVQEILKWEERNGGDHFWGLVKYTGSYDHQMVKTHRSLSIVPSDDENGAQARESAMEKLDDRSNHYPPELGPEKGLVRLKEWYNLEKRIT
jgi:hypothetical protein